MGTTQTAADKAYAAAKELILSGELAGGDLISENALSAQLGMSRTPMRVAFQRLESKGWLTLYPKRGAVVTPVTAEEKRDVLEARLAIETHSVAAVDPADRAALRDELLGITAEQISAAAGRNLTDFAELDVRFHRAIVARARNSVLLGFYDTLRERQQRMVESSVHARVRGRSSDPADPNPDAISGAEQIAAEHDALARLVASGDFTEFSSVLCAHLEATHDIHLPAFHRK
ncbi:GntR family transcriptional regulator [Dietzia sp.]|uniref:GntR family transcriptional regulator n=1 Tax=Dietzia sp. TaxID=1871616 RepID=UPI002FD8ED93